MNSSGVNDVVFNKGEKKMKKCIAAVLGLLIMAFATVCSAESYQMTYEAKNFTEKLENDQALSETFTTPYGALKLQMRKLWQSSSDNRLHLIAWLNDKRIDEYLPRCQEYQQQRDVLCAPVH